VNQTASQAATRTATSSTQVRRVDGCVPLAGGVRAVALHPPRSKPLRGVMLGSGTTAFVFSDESDEDLCGWLPFVKTLRTHGYSALLYDYVDPSALPADAAAAAAPARAAGARRVILIGASVGARGSIQAASANPPASGPLLRAMPSRRKRALLLPGVDHGTALLTGDSGPRVQRAILAFAASD
jgi:hypothetical protein